MSNYDDGYKDGKADGEKGEGGGLRGAFNETGRGVGEFISGIGGTIIKLY